MSSESAKEKRTDVNWLELSLDKLVDFVLIFIGLYAAMSVERCQDAASERDEYASLLQDFDRELTANVAQEASIVKDLGPIEKVAPPDNLGPLAGTFDAFAKDAAHDQELVHCLRVEFLRSKRVSDPACHAAFKLFHEEHKNKDHTSAGFAFKPVVLTPFYRYEVWQMYLAGGVKIFKNKELAVQIGEIYNNAHLVEKQVSEIEKLYNDTFMVQSGRALATDMELAELIQEEEEDDFTAEDRRQLIDVDESLQDERMRVLELRAALALQVERLKNTVLTMRKEIETTRTAITAELGKVHH